MIEQYEIQAKDIRVIVSAENKEEAWQKFFRQVIREGWGRQIGLIATMKAPGWKDEGDTIGARTPGVLWLARQITWDEAVEWMMMGVGFTKGEANQMLSKILDNDRQMLPPEIEPNKVGP